MIPRSRTAARRLACVFAVATGAMFSAASLAEPMARPKPLTAEAAAVKKLLEQKFEGASVTNIGKSPVSGLYEAMIDTQIVYTDAKVAYVIVGSIYDANTKKNLTEAKKRELSRVAFDSLPLNLAFKKVKGNGQRKLAVFSDPDCPYCAKLEQELKSIDNVTIYTFLYPIDQLHPDAARKARLVWCAPDKVRAWDEFFESGTLPKNDDACENPIAATSALGQQMGISATPTLIFADGSIIPGAIPAQRLEAEIKQGEAEAARSAAAKK
jgi:thiol:disulfide interchange protein DsbC